MARTRFDFAATFVLMTVLLVSNAGASVLVPGSTVIPAPFSNAPGTLLASITSPFTSVLGAGDYSGVAVEAVYRDAITSDLDFLYQFTNNATSGNPIEQMSDSSFTGFTTDVYFQLGGPAFGPFSAAGTVPPADASRTASGQTVSWQFSAAALGGVTPGATSGIVMIKTNATNFGPGNVSFINSGTITLTDFFGPAGTPPVPEPSSLLLLGSGLMGVLARRKLRS